MRLLAPRALLSGAGSDTDRPRGDSLLLLLGLSCLLTMLPQGCWGVPCTVSKADMPYLVVEIRYAHPDKGSGALVDSTFESCNILRSDTIKGALYGGYMPYTFARYGGKSDEHGTVSLFVPHGRDSSILHPVNTSEQVCVFHEYLGFERAVNVITVWREVHGELALEGVLDHSIDEGIGYAWIDSLFPTESQNAILIKGRSFGGDGGGYWGSIWFGYWRRPFRFDLLYRKRYEKPDSDDLLEVRLDDEFDSLSRRAIVTIWRRRGNAGDGTIAERDTVYIDPLIASIENRE